MDLNFDVTTDGIFPLQLAAAKGEYGFIFDKLL